MRNFSSLERVVRLGAETMINRNILYAIVGVLVIAVTVLGYKLYEERKKPEGLSINLGPSGLKIENK
jgi:hypothetical protein